jgi:hypothetical protein
MATLTFNAATAGVAQIVQLKGRADSNVVVYEVFLTPSGTYDQDASESVEITNIATAIAAQRRDGKTYTLIGACPGQSTFVSSTGYTYKWLTAVLNSTTVDATIYDDNGAAEYADDTALPTFGQPMSVIVAATVA